MVTTSTTDYYSSVDFYYDEFVSMSSASAVIPEDWDYIAPYEYFFFLGKWLHELTYNKLFRRVRNFKIQLIDNFYRFQTFFKRKTVKSNTPIRRYKQSIRK